VTVALSESPRTDAALGAGKDDLGAFSARAADPGSGRPTIAVKENIAVRGLPRRAGSRATEAVPGAADAAVVANLRAAGCAILGTTSMHELALGVVGDNTHFGPVTNPRAPGRIVGGSSSGSAAAVAAGLCDAALGTDTGGSVRLPAALCGVVGLKPRAGELSRDGVLAVSPTLDAVGVLAADVATAVRVLALGAGAEPVPPTPPVEPRLAVAANWLTGVTPEVAEPFAAAIPGAEETSLPEREPLAAAAGTVSLYEASRELSGLRTDPRLGADVAALLARGAEIADVAYDEALLAGRRARAELAAIFREFDAVLVPTVPCVAPRRGSAEAADRSRLTGHARPFNLTDSAVVTLPLPSAGLPAGVQVLAADSRRALAVAAALELRFNPNVGGTTR
jgi:amidase